MRITFVISIGIFTLLAFLSIFFNVLFDKKPDNSKVSQFLQKNKKYQQIISVCTVVFLTIDYFIILAYLMN